MAPTRRREEDNRRQGDDNVTKSTEDDNGTGASRTTITLTSDQNWFDGMKPESSDRIEVTPRRVFCRPSFSKGASGSSNSGGGRGIVVLNRDLTQFSDVQTRLLFVAGYHVTLF